eukprot:scaffold273915_cov21-Tisochrysis_lutea.AAC.1
MPSLCVASFDTGVKIHEPPMLLLQFLCLQRQCMTIVRTMRVLQLHCLHGQCMTIMKTMRVFQFHCLHDPKSRESPLALLHRQCMTFIVTAHIMSMQSGSTLQAVHAGEAPASQAVHKWCIRVPLGQASQAGRQAGSSS